MTLSSAFAVNCNGGDAEACAAGAVAADRINDALGAGTIANTGSRPFRTKTLFIQKKFAAIFNTAEASGCTILDAVGGSYDAGTGAWSGNRGTEDQTGAFAGGGMTGSDTDGFHIGLTTGAYVAGQVFADIDGESTEFQAGIYQRVAGNIGYVAMLLGTCPGDAGTAMDSWFQGDIAAAPPPVGTIMAVDLDGPSSSPDAEGVEHAVDGVGQKYLNFGRENSGLVIRLGSTVVDGLVVYTANDVEARDPASYRLRGSNTSMFGPWAAISTGPLDLPSARNNGGSTTLDEHSPQDVVTFPNNTPYDYYQLTFPTVKGPGNSMQIAEVEFLED